VADEVSWLLRLACTHGSPGSIRRRPFFDHPSPNRAGGFPRTRLSSTGIHPFEHRAGFTHSTTCSLAGEKTLTCSPSSCLRHYPERWATMGTPSPWGSRQTGDPAFAHVRRSSTCRCPVRFLALFIARYSPQRTFTSRCVKLASAVSPLQGCCDGRRISPLETGVQPMQASPLSCVQDLRLLTLHPFALSRFADMLLSPSGFPSRLVGCPRRC